MKPVPLPPQLIPAKVAIDATRGVIAGLRSPMYSRETVKVGRRIVLTRVHRPFVDRTIDKSSGKTVRTTKRGVSWLAAPLVVVVGVAAAARAAGGLKALAAKAGLPYPSWPSPPNWFPSWVTNPGGSIAGALGGAGSALASGASSAYSSASNAAGGASFSVHKLR